MLAYWHICLKLNHVYTRLLQDSPLWEKVKYIEEHMDVRDVSRGFILCQELLCAEIVKMMYPAYSGQLRDLKAVQLFSDAVFCSGSARLAFLKKFLPLQDAHYCADRAPAPSCLSGPRIDLLIAFIEACLATGQAEGASHLAFKFGAGLTLIFVAEAADGLALRHDIRFDEYSGNIVGLFKTSTGDIIRLFDDNTKPNRASLCDERRPSSKRRCCRPLPDTC